MRNRSIKKPMGALCGALIAATAFWSSGALAHCDPADGHFECPAIEAVTPSEPVPGPSDKLYANLSSKQSVSGPNGLKLKSEIVSQRYSNNARQWYFLMDVAVRLPARGLGISNRSEARAARPVVRYFHLNASQPFAECLLEPRTVVGRTAVYTLGLKANAAHTLLRWGQCDNAALPGHDAYFPPAIGSDKAVLVGADGQALLEFIPPVPVDASAPPKPKKLAQPAIARMLEGTAYRIKK